MAVMTQISNVPMQAVRQIVDSEKLCQIIDVPASMRYSQVEIIVLPVPNYSEEEYCSKDFANAIKELQRDSAINGNSDMTLEEINSVIALSRKERAAKKALK
jgi:hypothetical protein